MKLKIFFFLVSISYAVICLLPMLTAGYVLTENTNFINKIDNRNRFNLQPSHGVKNNFIELKNTKHSRSSAMPKPKTQFFKGLIKTETYKMNPQDNLSYSNTKEIIQRKFYFDVEVNMKEKIIHGFVRIFFRCNKKSKFFILDFKSLQIFKVLGSHGKNLNFGFIRNTKISKALGRGLKIELERECEVNQEADEKEKDYVDVYYSTTHKSVALHFSHEAMLEDKRYGFMYSHGAAIFARTLFPCQDSPFAKVLVEAKIRIEQPYTMLFAGELVSKKDLSDSALNNAVNKGSDNNSNAKLNKQKIIETLKSIQAKNNQTLALLANETIKTNKKEYQKLQKSKLSLLQIGLRSTENSLLSLAKSKKLTEFHFQNSKPISTYLITFAAGVLEKREFGDKCLVYGEADILKSNKTTASFHDCSKFVDFYDKKIHRNEWGKMIFLIIPQDFPYGGMENPYNIHVSKTVLTRDGSLRNVIAHEIAHFWSGNLVTNSNWEHFWLNEGFTNYLYRKCYQKLFGDEEFNKELEKSQRRLKAFLSKEAYMKKMRLQGEKEKEALLRKKQKKLIKQKIEKLQSKINKKSKDDSDDDENDNFDVVENKDKSHLSLWPKIRGTDPYNNFSLIPYEKGFSFLYFLETKFGEKFVFGLLRAYFSKFKFASATTNDFIELLKERIIQEKGEEQKAKIFKEINFKAWIHGTKSIPVTFKIKSKILKDLKAFSKKVVDFEISKEEAFERITKYNTYYQNYVLSLIGSYYEKIESEKISKYESTLNYIINRLFKLENKDLLEDSTKSRIIIMKATIMNDVKKKKEFLIKSLHEFKFYHISYLKTILSFLKFDCEMKNHQLLKVIDKIKARFNKLAVLRIMQYLYKR